MNARLASSTSTEEIYQVVLEAARLHFHQSGVQLRTTSDGLSKGPSFPILVAGAPVAYLESEKTDQQEGEQNRDTAILQQLAALAGLALEHLHQRQQNQRQLEKASRLLEIERHIVQAEIHDLLSQPLAALSLHLRRLKDDLVAQQAARTCTSLLGQLSNLMFWLRLPPLSHQGLANSLLQFENETLCATTLEIVGNLESVGRLTGSFLLRIIQESLINIGRHARASQVQLRLDIDSHRLLGRISDDGQGFEPASLASTPRWGIKGMQNRAELLGGWLRVSTIPGQGSTVEFALPIWETL